MNIQLRRLGAFLIVAVLTAAGCGGSSGGGDSVSPPPPTTTPPPSGGIIRSGVAVSAGPITGFGSVIVNGVRYNTDSATFIDDDSQVTNTPANEFFKVGETVIVKGTIGDDFSDDNPNAVAETVELDEIVEGPVSSINADGSITVLGQVVRIGLNTSVDDSCPASLDDASIGAVEVYGDVDVDPVDGPVIAATRIECKIPPGDVIDEYEVNGNVSSLDTENFTFMINALQVNYANALIDDNFPGNTRIISEGDPVEVEALPETGFDDSGTPPVLTASKVEYKGDALAGDAGDHFEVDGFISDFVSETEFNLNVGTLVIAVTTTPGTTVYEGGSAVDLANNLKIEVEGELDDQDVLNATKIEIKTSTNIRVTGQVDSVSTVDETITILNITVNTEVLKTEFEDKSEAGIESFSIANINVGDYIEARGQEQPPGQITAFRIERDDFDPDSDDTELRGFVVEGSVMGTSSFMILGVTVNTTSGTIYRDENDLPYNDPADFWDAVGTGGVIVDVNGFEEDDGTLTARELQLEME